MPIIDPIKISSEITDKYSIVSNAFSLAKIVNPAKDVYTDEPKDEINVIVGDDKVPDTFIPQTKLCRWSNEVNFSVRLVDTEVGQESVSTLADKIVWEKGNKKIEFYEYEDGEGGSKLVWYLKEKPKTNKVNFTIQSKGLDFFYQPPLTQEYQNGYSDEFQKEIVVSETQVKDLDGNVLVGRPENVVGSYAVYHQTKGGLNDINGKEYKVGKAFHIYRPHLIDANGLEAWGNLLIKDGIYSVEIPQDFLDRAVYPIKSNDTFGYESGGSYFLPSTNVIQAAGYTYSPVFNGTGNSITVNGHWDTNSVSVKMALYSNTTRIGYTTGVTLPQTTSDFATSNFVVEPSVFSATAYYLVFQPSLSSYGTLHYDVVGTTDQIYQIVSYASEFPNPASWTTLNNHHKFYIYATYTPSGGGVAYVPRHGFIHTGNTAIA